MVVLVVVCVSGATETLDDGAARLEGVAQLVERVGSSEEAGSRMAVCERLCERGVACGRCMGRDRLAGFLKVWGTRC